MPRIPSETSIEFRCDNPACVDDAGSPRTTSYPIQPDTATFGILENLLEGGWTSTPDGRYYCPSCTIRRDGSKESDNAPHSE